MWIIFLWVSKRIQWIKNLTLPLKIYVHVSLMYAMAEILLKQSLLLQFAAFFWFILSHNTQQAICNCDLNNESKYYFLVWLFVLKNGQAGHWPLQQFGWVIKVHITLITNTGKFKLLSVSLCLAFYLFDAFSFGCFNLEMCPDIYFLSNTKYVCL